MLRPGQTLIALASLAMVASVSVVQARPVTGADNIPVGQATLTPFGAIIFCVQAPQDCAVRDTRSYSARASVETLYRINARINRDIRPLADGDDEWNPNAMVGDCEDYALAKRRALIAAGVRASTLKIAIVVTRRGEEHAVLVANTRHGDLVLDNLTPFVRHWRDTDYRWIKIESVVDRRLWHRVAAL